MAEKLRCFTKFEKSMSKEDFVVLCAKIATQYARSDGQFARSYFMETYEISQSCFYRILQEAVIRHLVSEEMVRKMEQKALENQQAHAEKAGATTIAYYAFLREKRDEYTAQLYLENKKELVELVSEFANHPEIPKQYFAEKHDISIKVLGILLQEGIVNNMVEDDIVDKIERRSLAKNSSLKAKQYFAKLRQERNTKKTA